MIFGNKEQILYGNRFNGTKGNGYQPIKKPMTNEQWFCGLSTEEKAEWLSKHFHCGDCIFEKPMCGGEYDGCKSAFVEWLKGEHDGN